MIDKYLYITYDDSDLGIPHSSLVLTAKELASVVSRLESTRVAPWHVGRYLADLKPAVDEGFGRTRLYTVDDVCLVRLAVRLEREGVSAWVVRAVIANHVDGLTRAWRGDGSPALVLHGVRGAVVDGAHLHDLPTGRIAVRLRDIRHGIEPHIARVRRDQPTVPLFNRRLPVQDVLRARPA